MTENISTQELEGQIEAFSHRLHFNTILDILINALAGYLVLMHSTSAMKHYKYYIFVTIVLCLIMDIHLTLIYGMYRLFPANIVCAAGIAKNWGWFWGQLINYLVVHVLLSLSGGSVFIGFAYQYHSFTDDVNIFHTKRGIFGGIFTCFFFPRPLIALYIPCIDYDANKIDVLQNYPQFYEFFVTNACNSAIVNKHLIIYMTALVITLFIAFIIGVFFAWKIKKQLTEKQNILSAATLKLRKQYFFVLIIQMCIPLIFIVIPLTVISIFVFFDVGNSTVTFLWLLQLFSLHSCANAVTIVLVIKPYRHKLFQWLELVPFLGKKCFSKKINTEVLKFNQRSTSVSVVIY